ncbi:hypothetical protein [Ramlibacter rhizophilus]|uniref:Uncharacterized protein n=1 Tax=Ramlibacter rhizophilus TaxID=1781167 RepID=A0A4Z0C2X6_9BURK|nr:hypothetical protein [Ramlibacter rhizophilus]TFZ04549.1 hypothetical protein EZ242_02025 [Ramlibacter rhizophilus]
MSPTPSHSVARSFLESRQAHAPQRRKFLSWLSGATTALAVPSLLSACGGGDSAGSSGDKEVPSDARTVTLAAVEAKSVDLDAQPMPAVDRLHALAAFMKADPAYTEVGVEETALCVWGVFADGRLHIIDSSSRPVPAPAVAEDASARAVAKAAAPVELPGAKPARLLHSFGNNFVGQDVVTRMSSWLTAQDYGVRSGREGDARLTTLRSVNGDGFFYINTHGGVKRTRENDPASPLFFSIQSSTLVDPALENLPEMRDDFANQRLTYYNAPNGVTSTSRDTRYGITVHFVERYWSFAPDSVVIINACNSANPRLASSFLNACLNKGAGVCLGWTEVVGDPAVYDAPAYLVDRLLGANQEHPEVPKQRPFAWDPVLAEMRREGRDASRHPETGGEARFFAQFRGTVQTLAPSIHHLEVDEFKGLLLVIGEFGSKRGTVRIGEHDAVIESWSRNEVRVRLAQPGESGSHGPVVVEVDKHTSNARWLTLWTLRMRLQQHSPGSTALRVAGTSTVFLRGDVAPVRDRPGQDPQKVRRYAAATGNSHFPLRAEGSFSGITWSGDMNYMGVPSSSPAQVLSCRALLDADAGVGAIGLALGHGPGDGFLQSISGIPDSRFGVNLGLLDGFERFPSTQDGIPDVPLMALRFAFAADYAIPARHFTDAAMALSIDWERVEPLSAPTPRDRI